MTEIEDNHYAMIDGLSNKDLRYAQRLICPCEHDIREEIRLGYSVYENMDKYLDEEIRMSVIQDENGKTEVYFGNLSVALKHTKYTYKNLNSLKAREEIKQSILDYSYVYELPSGKVLVYEA